VTVLGALSRYAFTVGYVLLVLTLVGSVNAAWRLRQRHRLDILFFVSILVLVPFVRRPDQRSVALAVIGWALLMLVPRALSRLVSHFQELPRAVLVVTWGMVIVGPAAYLLRFQISPAFVATVLQLYLTAAFAWAAAAFGLEASRTAGIVRRRLVLALLGSAMFTATFLMASLAGITSSLIFDFGAILNALALGCFYLAFSMPRGLLTRWQRTEQAAYLTRVMDRDPETRGTRAAEDLFNAVSRSVGSGGTLVALKNQPDDDSLVVRAASAPALVGVRLQPATGLFGEASRSGRAGMGPSTVCEPDIAARLEPLGHHVIVAPIATSTATWGVVAAVQRRGTLFPEDDLASLSQLAKYAATALDHAHLVSDRRDRDRRAADRRLHELELRVGLMLDSIKDYAMAVLDGDGRIAAWHVGAEQLFGVPGPQIRGQSAAPFFGLSDSEFAAWLNEARHRGRVEREATCRRLDGTTFLAVTTVRPLDDDAGELPGFVVVTRDITEQRHLEDRLRQGQKMEAIGQLAGGIAHDFNNLLTAILGYTEWLHHELRGDARLSHVHEIQQAAERASDLVGQLLAFSRRRMLEPSTIDLGTLVAGLLPMLRRLIGEQIEIVDRTAGSLPPILGDRSQVEQIILNLAVNARDAMPAGGTLTIAARAEEREIVAADGLPAGRYVVLEVTDTGIGMDAETQRRAFEPFFTTKGVGRGTGLGLSTVYGIVHQMGGAISLDSVVHRGTSFRLTFPETASTADRAATLAPVESVHGNETVLLVEDDDSVRGFLGQVLRAHGYRVLVADHPDAAAALAASHADRIDLVIADVVMPGSTGPQLVATLHARWPNLAALYISGYADAALDDHPVPLRTGQLLMKPFSSAELLTRIRQILAAA
jgi:PAS domain S-box-containing protein